MFTNTLLDESVDIGTIIYSQQDVIESISNEEFRNLLPLATKQFYFIFNEVLYKQKDGVAIVSLLGLTLANAFLCFYERKWLEKFPLAFKTVFYRRYVGDIFVSFKSTDHLEKLRNCYNTCHPNMSFSSDKEKKTVKCPF